jgi:RimJ/RimL family protein N-acetyltransferase
MRWQAGAERGALMSDETGSATLAEPLPGGADDTADYPVDGRILVGRRHPSIREMTRSLQLPGFRARTVDPDGDDLDVIHRWMNSAAVAVYWEQAWTRDAWRGHLRRMLAGGHVTPLIVALADTDIAYVELYRAHADVVSRSYDSDPHDVGVHLAIGSPAHRGGGWGARIGAALLEAGFRAEPQCRRMLAEPDVRNAAAVRVNEALGLRRLGLIELPHKTAVLFAAERSAFERSAFNR